MTRTAALVVVVLAVAPRAAAFQCSRVDTDQGPSLAWTTRDLELRVFMADGEEASADELHDAAEFAAAQWTNVLCSDIEVSVGAPAEDRRATVDWSAASAEAPNENVIVFRGSDPSDLGDSWLHPVDALAITTVTYVRSSGRILDTDIEVNDARFRFTTCDPGPACVVVHDLKNTLVHEVGHVVGLDHPPTGQPGVEEVTMHRRAPEGDVEKRTLASDDEAGLCALYPAGGATGECYGVTPVDPPDVEVTASGCGAVEGSSALVVVALAALLRRPRRAARRAR